MCTNEDLKKHRDMLVGMRAIAADELSKQPGYDVTTWDAAVFTRIMERLRAEYGDVPGFNDALFTNTYYLVLGYVGGF